MRKTGIIIAAACIICVAAFFALFGAYYGGEVSTIIGKDGKPRSEEIAEKTFVDLNGTKLGMFLIGADKTKPVLLFLGGGPGIPEYLLEYMYPSGLEKDFIVCYLEYRGTSLSFTGKTDESTMTTQQYIEDVVAVTNYLRERFNREKIYVMAHSFGTFFGLQTAKLHPELYHAYIAMSQIANQRESEYEAFDYMKSLYATQGNKKKVAQFEKLNIRESEDDYRKYCISMLRDSSMHQLGIGTTRDMDSVITDILFPSLKCKAYTFKEQLNIWRGKAFAQSTSVGHASRDFDAFTEVRSLEIPVYFFAGVYDYTCCYSIQKKYYEALNAPVKGFYSFANSAHSPLFEESDKARHILTSDVLNGRTDLCDK